MENSMTLRSAGEPFESGSRPLLCAILLAMTFVVASLPAWAQPSMSRGQQEIAISYDECLRRAQQAFASEGWGNIWGGGSFLGAYKGENSAVIMCNPSPGNRMWVNIVASSFNRDGNVPGAERVRLQQAMDRPSVAAAPPQPQPPKPPAPPVVTGGNPGTGNLPPNFTTGAWNYVYESGYTEPQFFSSDGTVRGSVTGKWSVEGNELVIRWSHGWVMRYGLPAVNNRMTGVAIRPEGSRHATTLSR